MREGGETDIHTSVQKSEERKKGTGKRTCQWQILKRSMRMGESGGGAQAKNGVKVE